MENHLSQTARSHINMIENLYNFQLNQNSILQQKLDGAEKKLRAYSDQYGELKTSNLQRSTPPPAPAPALRSTMLPPSALLEPSGGAIRKMYEN